VLHQRTACLTAGILAATLALAGCGADSGRGSESGMSDAEPAAETLIIPAGTELVVALRDPVSTEEGDQGDVFQGTIGVPVIVDGKTVLPTGTPVRGRIQTLVKPDAEGPTRLDLVADEIEHPNGEILPVSTGPLSLVSETTARDDLAKVFIGTVAGGIIGGVAGGRDGAVAGAAVGAGAGTIVAIATGEDGHIEIPAGQKVMFHTSREIHSPAA